MKMILQIFVVFSPLIAYSQTKIKVEELLHVAELKRLPWAKMSLDASLTDSSNTGNMNATYRVYFNGDQTLVDCVEPASQKGNLVLLKDHDMWFYIRSTAQPMKITPLQKLSGSVSFLDIARLNWYTDYAIGSSENSKNKISKREACLLHLKAIMPGASYKKIDLWIDKSTKRALQADIYLSSEKLYKTILFVKYEVFSGSEMNTEIELIDHFNKERKSVIKFSRPQHKKNLPDNYFIKENLPQVSKSLNP